MNSALDRLVGIDTDYLVHYPSTEKEAGALRFNSWRRVRPVSSAVITLDRFLVIIFPFHLDRLQMSRTRLIIAAGWLVVALLAASPLMPLPYFRWVVPPAHLRSVTRALLSGCDELSECSHSYGRDDLVGSLVGLYISYMAYCTRQIPVNLLAGLRIYSINFKLASKQLLFCHRMLRMCSAKKQSQST